MGKLRKIKKPFSDFKMIGFCFDLEIEMGILMDVRFIQIFISVCFVAVPFLKSH